MISSVVLDRAMMTTYLFNDALHHDFISLAGVHFEKLLQVCE